MSSIGRIVVPRTSVVKLIAMPPKSAVGRRCQRSSFGFATYPSRCARVRQTGVRTIENVRPRTKYQITEDIRINEGIGNCSTAGRRYKAPGGRVMSPAIEQTRRSRAYAKHVEY